MMVFIYNMRSHDTKTNVLYGRTLMCNNDDGSDTDSNSDNHDDDERRKQQE